MPLYTGTSKAETIVGSSGNDSIYGLDGNDRLITLDGNDLVEGGGGDDEINAFYSVSDLAFLVYPSSGTKQLSGGSGNDTIHGSKGPDTILGDMGDDHLAGDTDSDSISGGDGNDTIHGNAGNDTLDGGAGDDDLDGMEGDDTYLIDSIKDRVTDVSGRDEAYVSVSWAKIPASIESVIMQDGAQKLPYWIDAMIPGTASGGSFESLIGPSRTMYFAFPTSPPVHDIGSGRDVGFTAMNAKQMVQVRKVLEYFQSLVNLQFVETSDTGRLNSINFSYNTPGFVGGYANQPTSTPSGSDLYISLDEINKTLAEDTFGLGVLIHELGHSLGLKHPTDTKFENQNAMDEGPFLPDSEAKTSVTVMGQKVKDISGFKISISTLDIAALQYLYGPSKTVRTENDTYALKTAESNFIWDAVGTDAVTAAGANQPLTLYLEPGYWSHFGAAKAATITSAGQITINFGSVIENAIGTVYADSIYGNASGNLIEGGEGSDSIGGGAGNDTLIGGSGDDLLDGGEGLDRAIFSGRREDYQSVKLSSGSWQVADQRVFAQVVGGPQGDGTDQLIKIERLKFSDKSLAMDLDGNAGNAARLLCTAFGQLAVKDPVYAGILINVFDQGLTKEQISQLAIDFIFGTKSTSSDVVKLVWKNLVGTEIRDSDLNTFTSLIGEGRLFTDSKAFISAVSDLDVTAQVIDLVGLSKAGWEYIPYGG